MRAIWKSRQSSLNTFYHICFNARRFWKWSQYFQYFIFHWSQILSCAHTNDFVFLCTDFQSAAHSAVFYHRLSKKTLLCCAVHSHQNSNNLIMACWIFRSHFIWTNSDCFGSALGGLWVNIAPTVSTIPLPVNWSQTLENLKEISVSLCWVFSIWSDLWDKLML